MNRLQRLAAAGPVPVFVAAGEGGAAGLDTLWSTPGIELVASPRHARILVVTGELRAGDHAALKRVHAQMPPPRATLWWGSEPPTGFPAAASVTAGDSPVEALRELNRRRSMSDLSGEPILLPDEPPARWRGLGDHGQGGEGMMGGTPYGRMMPMPPQADGRDGLALDVYTATYGPFLPMLPPGLSIELTLQGDVVQTARIRKPPYPDSLSWLNADAHEAAHRRAADHLRGVARLLSLLELSAWAERLYRAAGELTAGRHRDIAELHRKLRRTGAFLALPPKLGRLPTDIAWALGGVTASAMASGGDVRARARHRLFAAERWVAGDCTPADQQEAAEVPVDHAVTDDLLGLEWGEALLVLASFDGEALRRMAPRQQDEAPIVDADGSEGEHD